jgi:hypothetical protein
MSDHRQGRSEQVGDRARDDRLRRLQARQRADRFDSDGGRRRGHRVSRGARTRGGT